MYKVNNKEKKTSGLRHINRNYYFKILQHKNNNNKKDKRVLNVYHHKIYNNYYIKLIIPSILMFITCFFVGLSMILYDDAAKTAPALRDTHCPI